MTPQKGAGTICPVSTKTARPRQLSPVEETVLLAVLAEMETFAEIDESLLDSPQPYLVTMRQSGIPYRPDAWCHARLSAARRKAFSRAAVRLERRGWLVRLTQLSRDHVTHLRLTERGLALALTLAPMCDREQL
jgi:hypothetical protein